MGRAATGRGEAHRACGGDRWAWASRPTDSEQLNQLPIGAGQWFFASLKQRELVGDERDHVLRTADDQAGTNRAAGGVGRAPLRLANSAGHLFQETCQLDSDLLRLVCRQLRDDALRRACDLVVASPDNCLQLVESFVRALLPEVPGSLADLGGIAHDANASDIQSRLANRHEKGYGHTHGCNLKLSERDGRPCPIIAFVAWGVFFEKNQNCFPWHGSNLPDDESPVCSAPSFVGRRAPNPAGHHREALVESCSAEKTPRL